MNKKGKIRILLSLLLTGTLLYSGCGKSTGETTSGVAQTNTMVEEYATDSGWTDNGEVMSEESVPMSKVSSDISTMDVSSNGRADSGSSASSTSSINSTAELDAKNTTDSSRKLIKNASLTLETKEFDATISAIEKEIDATGGYAEYSNTYTTGSDNSRYGSITARIPSDRLEEFLTAVGDMAVVKGKSENVQDVTLEYTDTEAHKKSLQTEYDRVTELLQQAEDIDQILALESKLSDLRYQIDSYESQLRIYDNQVDYSTVNLDITEVRYETETAVSMGDKIKNGFQDSIYWICDAAEALVIFVAANSPILILVLVILLVLWRILRKKRRKAKMQLNSSKENLKQENSEETKSSPNNDSNHS